MSVDEPINNKVERTTQYQWSRDCKAWTQALAVREDLQRLTANIIHQLIIDCLRHTSNIPRPLIMDLAFICIDVIAVNSGHQHQLATATKSHTSPTDESSQRILRMENLTQQSRAMPMLQSRPVRILRTSSFRF